MITIDLRLLHSDTLGKDREGRKEGDNEIKIKSAAFVRRRHAPVADHNRSGRFLQSALVLFPHSRFVEEMLKFQRVEKACHFGTRVLDPRCSKPDLTFPIAMSTVIYSVIYELLHNRVMAVIFKR